MDIQNRQGLKRLAAQRLGKSAHIKKIVLLWAGVSALVSLLVSLISFLLDSQIESTGGLSGIGLRSFLETAQSLLSLANMILMPFWSLGFISCILQIARKEEVQPQGLLEGFRRIGPALRMMLLQYLLYLGISFGAVYLGCIVFSMTPLAEPMYVFLEHNQEAFAAGTLSEAQTAEMFQAMIPVLIGSGLLCIAVLIPVSYRLRLANYRLMDEPRCRARESLRESNRLMYRNCISLFKLDLSFWWYFLAKLLINVLCFGDFILAALGIPLPMGTDLAFFLFYILGLGAQLALLYWKEGYVQTTYALFYRSLSSPEEGTDTAAAVL